MSLMSRAAGGCWRRVCPAAADCVPAGRERKNRRFASLRCVNSAIAGWAMLVCLLLGGVATAQISDPIIIPEPAFPKLFPRYTGLNGYEDLVQAGDLLATVEVEGGVLRAAEGGTLKMMRRALEDPKVDRALQLARVGLDKPIKSPRDPEKMNEDTILPEYAGFRRLARAMGIEEQVYLADGRVSKAIDTMRDGLRLGYVIQSETLIGGLVGIAVDAIAVQPIARHFDQLALRDCIQVMAVAEEWLKLPGPAESVLTDEHQFLVRMMGQWRTDTARLRKQVKEMEPQDAPASDSEMAALELSGYVDAQPNAIPDMVDKALAIAETDYRARIAEMRKPTLQRKAAPKIEARASMANRLYNMISPSYDQALDKFDLDRARIALLGTHAAIRRYRWENNHLPASLAELKLPALTTDPITGSPLVYKVTGDTFELYSVGTPARGDSSNGGASQPAAIYLPHRKSQ